MSTVWHIEVGARDWAATLARIVREAEEDDTIVVDTDAKAALARRAAARLGKRLAVKMEAGGGY